MIHTHNMQPIEPIKPIAPYLGGKRNLAALICERIADIAHKTYAEPFGGMGGIFLRRKACPPCEVFNDLSDDVVTLFRIARKYPDTLLEELKYQHTSRSEFDRLKHVDPDLLTDVERAARFLYLQKCAFGGIPDKPHFGVQKDMRGRFNMPALMQSVSALSERLERVVIEKLPYQDLIRHYDGPNTLFYLDPPYWDCEQDYGRGMFAKQDFVKLADQLTTIKGRFIMSINATPEIRDIFGGFDIEEVRTTYSVGRAATMRARELLIFK